MQMIDALHSLLLRLSIIMMWLTVALVHLALFLILFATVWYFEIPPRILLERFFGFVQSLPVAIAGVLGVSALTILLLWLKLCRIVFGKLTTPFLFRDIDANVRK